MNPMHKVPKVQAKVSAPLLAGLLYAFITMLVLVLIVSLFMAGSGMDETSLSTTVYIIHALSLFIGGFAAGKKKGARGWYHGGMLGLLYWLIIMLVGFLGFDASIGLPFLIGAGVCFVAGAIGGIIGVNSAK